MVLKNIILKYKFKLLLTYSIFGLEMLANLLRPFFLGEAVNGILAGSYNGLIYLGLVHIAYMVFGTIRHMYDTRTYTGIYTALVTKMLARRFGSADISKLSAHSNLARDVTDFLEYDLNFIIEAAYNIVGSLLLLYFYDHSVVMVCLAVLVPVSVISYRYGQRMEELTKSKNDELEKQVDIISTQDSEAIKHHYVALRRWQIKISDKEAFNFGIMELLVLPVIIISLLLTASHVGTTIKAGDIIGIYNYLLKFISGLDTIPYSVQRFTNLKDITQRIEFEDDDID